MARTIIGIMGPGAGPSKKDLSTTYQLGKSIAGEQWILLTGGRSAGVMEAAAKGAREAGGLTVGILPGADRAGMSPYVDIPITTGMGSARNNINVLSSDVIVACGTGAGTASEILLALKAGTPVVLLNQEPSLLTFLGKIPYENYRPVEDPAAAIEVIKELLKTG